MGEISGQSALGKVYRLVKAVFLWKIRRFRRSDAAAGVKGRGLRGIQVVQLCRDPFKGHRLRAGDLKAPHKTRPFMLGLF
jgi:hypothetical protein